jgi:glycosyltransferase involved in cell wall biosynthesis
VTRRVLFITGEYPPMRGGISDYTACLAHAMGNAGWEPWVLTHGAAQANPDPRVLSRITKWDWSLAGSVRQAITDSSADIVHIQYQTGAFAMHPAINLLPFALKRSRPEIPVVTTLHDLRKPYLFPKAGVIRRWANRALAFGSARIVVTNRDDYRQLKRFPRLAQRTEIIPLGGSLPEASVTEPASVRRELGIAEQGCAIGFFGFVTPDKGLDILIDALESLPALHPHLVIVGGELADTDLASSSYAQHIRQRLNDTPVPVIMTGHLDARAAADTLAVLDLIVLPFRSGATLRSSSLIAAIRTGIAVVTTAPRGHDSLHPLKGGESIELAPAGDVQALAREIRSLLVDTARRKRLADRGKVDGTAFDLNAMASRHVGFYSRLLQAAGAARGQE